MLQMCILDLQGIGKIYPSLADFAYNNGSHSSFGMAPYKPCMEEKVSPWLIENRVLLDFETK